MLLAGILAGLAAIAYGILAIVAVTAGRGTWLEPCALCWPELCNGGGCIFYRIVCAPLVLLFHAVRIFCGTCCCIYLRWACFSRQLVSRFWGSFTDPDFPRDSRSLGVIKGDTASGVLSQNETEWAKASEIAGGSEARLFEGTVEAADLLQGALGNCWLIAGLASVAERPEILQRVIVSKTIDLRGKYVFRLWDKIGNENGTQWKTITIDEYIPVHKGTKRPKFAQANGNEMWAMLVEKAFAKMYGSYGALEGGQMSWALSAITGNRSVHFTRDAGSGKWNAFVDAKLGASGQATFCHTVGQDETFSDDAFYRFLHKLRRQGAFICCAGIANVADPKGLINGHAYSVIQLCQVNRSRTSTEFFRFVQIRNPHGGGGWKGAWSAKSSSWEKFPYVRDALSDRELVEDGTFWMQWGDFVTFWSGIQVVDCETSIRTTVSPLFDELSFSGPTRACLLGCLKYWCCCLSCARLYFGRAGAQDVAGMKTNMDQRIGVDQTGCFCDVLKRNAVTFDEESESVSSEESGDSASSTDSRGYLPLPTSGNDSGDRRQLLIGTERRKVLGDTELAASTVHGPSFAASKCRMDSTTAWSPQSPGGMHEWLCLDFRRLREVAALETKGSGMYAEWTTQFRVSYSVDGAEWKVHPSIFEGNTDSKSVKQNVLVPPLRARSLKLHPIAWHSHSAIRVEALGRGRRGGNAYCCP